MERSRVVIREDGKVMLFLEGKTYKPERCIGKIVGDAFRCQRVPSKHLFVELNAYGFNHELMEHGTFSRVIVELPLGIVLETSRKNILEKGIILNYERNNLERQLFLRLEDFNSGEESTVPFVVTHPDHPQNGIGVEAEDTPECAQEDLFGGVQ